MTIHLLSHDVRSVVHQGSKIGEAKYRDGRIDAVAAAVLELRDHVAAGGPLYDPEL